MKAIPMLNRIFGRLTVLSEEKGTSPKKFLCRCECGKEAICVGWSLRAGKTVSCGCRRRLAAVTHAQSGSREYQIWHDMVRRCTDPSRKNWKFYGGRGIRVCEAWLKFDAFYRDMGPANGLTIERVNNDGNYEPGNCVWKSPREQARNRRSSRLIEFQGQTYCLSEWAERIGITREALKQRISRGWPIEKALNQGGCK